MAARAIEYQQQYALPTGQDVEFLHFKNGLEVYLIHRPGSETIALQSWIKIGSYHEKCDPHLNRTGLAHFFEHMMFRGTKRYPDGFYDKILTGQGAIDINASTWLDRTNYYVTAPKEALEDILKLESDRLRGLKITPKLFEKERGAVLGEYAIGKDDPELMAFEALYALAFLEHPYRFSPMGTEKEIKSFTVEEARYLYETYYRPNHLQIIVVGKIPKNAKQLFSKYYGSIPSNPVPKSRSPSEPKQLNERRVVMNHGNFSRDFLAIGYRVPPMNHVDHAVLTVLQTILTVGRGSFFQQKWIETGLASHCDGSIDEFQDPGLFCISATLQSGISEDTIIQSLDEILNSMLHEQIPLERQLKRAKNLIFYDFYENFEDNTAIAAVLGESLISYGDIFLPFKQMEVIEQVSETQIQNAIRKYLHPGNRSLVIGKPIGKQK